MTQTPGKGHATPKRRDAQNKRRGPVAPAPQSAKEARARRKDERVQLKAQRKSRTPEQRKADRELAKAARMTRRERMMNGEDQFLLPRDRGPEKAYARDLVDSKRHLCGLFMPFAIIMLSTLFFGAAYQAIVTLIMVGFMVAIVAEGYLIGRTVNRAVAEQFPSYTGGGFRLGWYGFVRATQLRKLRVPKPRVRPGDAV